MTSLVKSKECTDTSLILSYLAACGAVQEELTRYCILLVLRRLYLGVPRDTLEEMQVALVIVVPVDGVVTDRAIRVLPFDDTKGRVSGGSPNTIVGMTRIILMVGCQALLLVQSRLYTRVH